MSPKTQKTGCYTTVTCLFSGILDGGRYFVGGVVVAFIGAWAGFWVLLLLKMVKTLSGFWLLHLLQSPAILAETFTHQRFQHCNTPLFIWFTVTLLLHYCYKKQCNTNVTERLKFYLLLHGLKPYYSDG
jgi:hypothetical protein